LVAVDFELLASVPNIIETANPDLEELLIHVPAKIVHDELGAAARQDLDDEQNVLLGQ
jgi:hypothetical protein